MNEFFVRRPALALFLPAWLAFVLYLPTLGYSFVWDDVYFIVDSAELRDPALLWQTLARPLFVSHDYFRPLPLALFALEARLGGATPFVFHLSNTLLHALNTLLIVLLARTLSPGRPLTAALAGLLFACHPALVENVAWISDRFDLLMCTCLLTALLVQARVASRLWRALLVALFFCAALLCKETSVVLLVLWPLWTLYLARLRTPGPLAPRALWRSESMTALALLLALASYLGLRWLALGYLYIGDAQMTPGTPLQHLLLIARTLGWYLLLALWPFGQVNPAHPAATPLAPNDALAWLALAVVAALSLLLARTLWRRRGATPLSLVALAALALAPVANLVPLTIGDNLVSDRYLILPLALLALAVSQWLAHTTWRWPHLLALLWCLACAGASLLQMPVWRDNLSLWQAAVSRAPSSEVARQNLLAAQVTDGQYAEAEQLARAWLAAGNAPASVRHNLALALAHQGRHAEAEAILVALLAPRATGSRFDQLARSEALNLLAFARLQAGRPAEALAPLHEAIQLTPDAARPRYHLALALYALGEIAAGDASLQAALQLAHGSVVDIFRRKGDAARQAAVARLSGK